MVYFRRWIVTSGYLLNWLTHIQIFKDLTNACVCVCVFVDNSLLFCWANDNDCQTILDILSTYKQASGQQISRGKNQLFFSTNTYHHTKIRISDLSGVYVASQYEKQLCLPSFVGQAKKTKFQLYQSVSLAQNTRVERKTYVPSKPRSPRQIRAISNANFHCGLLQTAKKPMQRH